MKYKVGDKVRIVDTKDASLHWNQDGKMDKWLGETMTIRAVEGDHYKMVEDNGERSDRAGWSWFEEMIAGLATKYQVGDKVKVRDDLGVIHYKMSDGVTADCVIPDMLRFKGKIVTIESITDTGKYRIKEFACNWTDGMFAGLACEQKIVITSDGVTTLARLYEGSKVVKSAEAKCSPDDEFKFETGAKLAMERLYAPESKLKFKIGDRVKHDRWGVGTVVYVDRDDTYAVEFDKANSCCHSCLGHTKADHGRWCDDNDIEAYVAPKFKKGDWVRIIGKPTTGERGIIHDFDIGDVVKIRSVDSDNSYYCQRPYDDFEQFVSAKDVESPKK